MGRPLVSRHGFGVVKFSQLLLNGFDTPLQPGDILLLLEKLLIELSDGFILQGRQGFKMDDAFLHGGSIANLQGKRERFHGLLH